MEYKNMNLVSCLLVGHPEGYLGHSSTATDIFCCSRCGTPLGVGVDSLYKVEMEKTARGADAN